MDYLIYNKYSTEKYPHAHKVYDRFPCQCLNSQKRIKAHKTGIARIKMEQKNAQDAIIQAISHSERREILHIMQRQPEGTRYSSILGETQLRARCDT